MEGTGAPSFDGDKDEDDTKAGVDRVRIHHHRRLGTARTGGKRARRKTQTQLQAQGHRGGKEPAAVSVLVRIPKHSSVLPYLLDCHRNRYRLPGAEESIDAKSADSHPCQDLHLLCHRPGVLWRGLLPLVFSSLSAVEEEAAATPRGTPSQRMLLGLGLRGALDRAQSGRNGHGCESGGEACVHMDETTQQQQSQQQSTPKSNAKSDGNETSMFLSSASEWFYERMISIPLALLSDPSKRRIKKNALVSATRSSSRSSNTSVCLYLHPPLRSDIDRTLFASIVSGAQRGLVFRSACTAWCSTLGGGYFGVRDLAKSLRLSRHLRALALRAGDVPLARQCTVHEAYNHMYAGMFGAARALLGGLEREVEASRGGAARYTAGDERILGQSASARECLRRLEESAGSGLGAYRWGEATEGNRSPSAPVVSRTVDDFQRLRIVAF